ncbi:hypothetical protein P171DRAFT_433411 [Karstenula rhodostoma CBS 690.94]|uniref:Apple domain-containing protein n=1 Tax=Karstenula rhodostoma CBS 690.94 TaxID=1392251 RepID=A0A9P4PFQ0_9PLEO|nr:hypothetical protein P171DRAFT_433411 [Karstenula rhodostoma CBS 690.94]
MSGCSFVAPGLVAQVSGQAPIFNYVEPHTSDYFGLQMNYLQSTSTCYGVNSIPEFTPIIQNTAAGYTKTCQFLAAESSTGILCTGAPVTEIPDGKLTVTFQGYTGNANTAPIPFTASFGPSPAAATTTNTATVIEIATQTSTVDGEFASTSTVDGGFATTVTASGGPSSTQTAYTPSTTVTTTNVVGGTTAVTITETNTVSSCSSTTTSGPPVVISSSTTTSESSTSSTSSESSTAASSTASSTSSTSSTALVSPTTTTNSTSSTVVTSSTSSTSSVESSSSIQSIPSSTTQATPSSSTIVSTTDADSPTSTTTVVTPTPVTGAPQCPENDKSIYTSSCGAQYIIECSTDRYGGDLPNGFSTQNSFAACIDDCDTTAGCITVSWVISGGCYKKGSTSAIRTDDNVWGALQLSECTAPTGAAKFKLHRKRVVRSGSDVAGQTPVLKSKTLDKRAGGIAYAPDETYITTTTTVSETTTVASTVTATTTASPSGTTTVTASPSGITTVTASESGVSTTTSLITATVTADSTSFSTSTATVTAAVTTCPSAASSF